MRILDDTHIPAHYIDIELVKPKGGNPEDWSYSLTKKRGYDHRYQATVTFETNVSQYDDSGMELMKKEITKAIEKALSTEPTLNENQQIVLEWFKEDYVFMHKLESPFRFISCLDYAITHHSIYIRKNLTNEQQAQVLQVFVSWVLEQEEE